ncbi:MAG: SDR family NAD(P)-dependent oxidoreductase [Chloroflexi bacterium]|nr:SDR family NAD(P)-dependent oxidoreductase [Chloroflexota bacterium]
MDFATFTKMYDFTNCSIFITGGTGVLGSAMVQTLVGCGANVTVLARDTAKAKRLLETLSGPGRVLLVQGDVLKRDTLLEAAQKVMTEFGQIDALINSAGGNKPEALTGPDRSFFDLPEAALRFVFDLNLLGAILPSQVFGKLMAERGEGVILNISSMTTFRPLTRIVGYSAAKAGLNNFTQWLAVYMAQEYSPRIRVNAIAPGFFLTEQNRYMLTDKESGFSGV